jgi:hypothetical protein
MAFTGPYRDLEMLTLEFTGPALPCSALSSPALPCPKILHNVVFGPALQIYPIVVLSSVVFKFRFRFRKCIIKMFFGVISIMISISKTTSKNFDYNNDFKNLNSISKTTLLLIVRSVTAKFRFY